MDLVKKEMSESIVTQGGGCTGIRCCDCPLYSDEKGSCSKCNALERAKNLLAEYAPVENKSTKEKEIDMKKREISMDKEYITVDGSPVKIYAVYPEHNSVHGAIYSDISGEHKLAKWDIKGDSILVDTYNLIEKPERVQTKVWLNIYKNGNSGVHNNKTSADFFSTINRVACVAIALDLTEGYGLKDCSRIQDTNIYK